MSETLPQVVVTHWVHPEVIARLEQFCRPAAPSRREGVWPRAKLLARVGSAAGLVTCMADRIDEELLAACPELRVVAAVAKGHDNIDLRACTDRGVWVTNLPDLLTGPTAELAVGLTLALLRRITEADTSIRSDGFTGWRPDFYATSLQGSTVGILGMGRLGHALARRVAAFDAQVLYHDPHPLIPTLAAKHGTRAASLEELLAGSDIVVPLLPLTPETQGLLDAKALAMMRPGAFLVNVGRGSVVDEDAIADALETGRMGGYGADVFACEDLGRPDRPERIPPRLLASPRTVFTSHLGSAVDKVRRDMGLAAVGQVQQALAGERPEYALNEVIG